MITRIEIEGDRMTDAEAQANDIVKILKENGYDIEWQRDMRLGFFPTYVFILLNKEKINN